MLAVLNQYAHGLVILPTLVASREGGLFAHLGEEPISFTELTQRLSANPGPLRVVLRMLDSLGWIERDGEQYRSITTLHNDLPSDAAEFVSFDFEGYLSGRVSGENVARGLARSASRWGAREERIAMFADGVMSIPLLLAMKERGLLDASTAMKSWDQLAPSVARDLRVLFGMRGWLTLAGDDLSESGRFIADRILNVAVVASYRPMLARMSELLFGDYAVVFERDDRGRETHVARTLNVLGSGFQHGKYFADLEAMVRELDREANAPLSVVDTGCGDGSLLRRLHAATSGRARLVGVDYNEHALRVAERTLSGIPHQLLRGDIGEPRAIADAMVELGIGSGDRLFHVRTFLDHDRPYRPPVDAAAARARAGTWAASAAHVDRNGNEIPHHDVIQSLVEHLGRWSAVVGDLGLGILEVHAVGPATLRRHPEVESLHFDAYHSFSGQLLVQADEFIDAAAEVGLFPDSHSFRKYPRSLPFARISLARFERRSYAVRRARLDDSSALESLDHACWPAPLWTERSTLEARIREYPAGQLVLEEAGRIVAAIYSRRIDATTPIDGDPAHIPSGELVQLLGVQVLPSVQDQQLGDQLLEFMLLRSAVVEGVRGAIGVTRPRGFYQSSLTDIEEYVRARGSRGLLLDPILQFHERHGAKIGAIIPGYRPADFESGGYGVVVEYDLFDRRSRHRHVPPPSRALRDTTVRPRVIAAIDRVRGNRATSVDSAQPLMEMGLDSADLLELAEQLRERFAIKIGSTFFFENNTADKVIAALERRMSESDASALQHRHALSIQSPAAVDHAERAVAIVGIACRLPGEIAGLDDLWKLVEGGRSAISRVPPGRWNWPLDVDVNGAHRGVDHGGFLSDVARFDASFFRISPREAERLDPQQRILLELTWACIEDAGHAATDLARTRTGVYVGASGSDYRQLLSDAPAESGRHDVSGTAMAAVANRISYYFDLNGPSVQIDTACSSSLVALHEAACALREGRCDNALVGGVHVMCHPANTLAYFRAGMLAKDGRCKTFDRAADGYVRSEGAVMIWVKRLEDAVRDGDAIHAIMRGGAVNHGGQASGLTVPNPALQRDLLRNALRDAGLAPEDITYIEAHGTGTALGDPIEVHALRDAFEDRSTGVQPWCGLGSIKTYLGHLEAVAGLTGVLSVVASMRHGRLPKTLHFEGLNPKIALAGGGFEILTSSREWRSNTRRRAGVSSFGSGGTNAHVILEEHVGQAHVGSVGPQVFVLSARNPESLAARARDLRRWIDECAWADRDLSRVAYTLQVGRVPMQVRLAFVAATTSELRQRLDAFLDRQPDRAVHLGKGERAGFALSSFGQDEQVQTLARNWFAQGRLNDVIALWVDGVDIEWSKMHAHPLERVHLPTYPFAGEKHWIGSREFSSSSAGSDRQHPLLHERVPLDGGRAPGEERFTTRLTGEELVVREHIVGGKRVLPGVAYLEMVREAIARIAPDSARKCVRLHRVMWPLPCTLDSPRTLHLVLRGKRDATFDFEVWSVGDDEVRAVHARGRASLVERDDANESLLAGRELLTTAPTTSIDLERVYRELGARGLQLGHSFQGLTALAVASEGQAPDALARIDRPASSDPEGTYILHPSVLDSALQVGLAMELGLLEANAPERPLAVPFTIATVDVLGALPETSFVRARRAGATVDIDVVDEQGNALVLVRGFEVRRFAHRNRNAIAQLAIPRWQPQALEPVPTWQFGERRVLALSCREEAGSAASSLAARRRDDRRLDDESGAYQDAVLRSMVALRELGARREDTLLQVVVPAGDLSSGLLGLLATGRLEYPRVRSQLLVVERDLTLAQIDQIVSREAESPRDGAVRHTQHGREVMRWTELEPIRDRTIWRPDAVHLITGGAGALGRKVALHVAQRATGTTLALIGRSPFNARIAEVLGEIEDVGGRAVYEQCDVADLVSLERCIAAITSRFGAPRGIFHTAGVLRDGLLRDKTERDVATVLAPKVAGTLNLDHATRALALDHFVLFSSTTGTLGNVGQADYAAANGFLDAFAERRAARVERGERSGRTVSIAWPLWRDGGMQAGAAGEASMRARGLVPLDTDAALAALGESLASSVPRVLVTSGEASRVYRSAEAPNSPPASARVTHAQDAAIDVAATLLRLAAKVLKMDVDAVSLDRPFGDYGFDSILFTELAAELNAELGLSIAPTMFFDHPDLRSIAKALVDDRAPAGASDGEEQPQQREPFVAERAYRSPRPERVSTSQSSQHAILGVPEPIAIVGMSGSFPDAPTLADFWRNITAGVHSVREVPNDRWDWRTIHGDPSHEPSKTNVIWGTFLADIGSFDAAFFGILPAEAATMDPQQRLVLEHAWNAIEDAGYAPSSLAGSRTAVFMGMLQGGYRGIATRERHEIEGWSSTGMMVPSVGPNRLSHLLDLRGPSEHVEAACSSSLVAVHRAVQALRTGEADAALAGGVNTLLDPELHVSFSRAGMLSPDGRCRPFARDANGYVRGEGVGVVMLKRLSDAERDGDPIHAVIRATATNHRGRTNSLTAPGSNAEAELVRRAHAHSKIDPATVGYVETHSTGTLLGDPLEIRALQDAFARTTSNAPPCGIGSVKGNIGHLEIAAGMASIFKVVLQMQHGAMVKTLHCEEVNPYLALDARSFFLVNENRAWPAQTDASGHEMPRRAAIGAASFTGVNAYMVIEEQLPSPQEADIGSDPACVILSARDESALRRRVEQLVAALAADALPGRAPLQLSALAYTLQVGRDAMPSRLATVVVSIDQLREKLNRYLGGEGQIAGLWTANGTSADPLAKLLATETDVGWILSDWIEKRKFETIARAWTLGLDVDFRALHRESAPRRVHLPAYPFARIRHWLGARGAGAIPAAATSPPGDPTTSRLVRQCVAHVVGTDESTLDESLSLTALGIHSIHVVMLRNTLERALGFEVPLHALRGDPTVAELSLALASVEPTSKAEGNVFGASSTVSMADPDARFEPFPLTEMQEAFLAGRMRGGENERVGCHLYFELDVSGMDLHRLDRAWRRTVDAHDMLRMVVLADGMQRILRTVPMRRLRTIDLQRCDATETAARLTALRREMSHRVYDLETSDAEAKEAWPLFDLRFSVQRGGRTLLHASFDELILDAQSLDLVLDFWQRCYDQTDALPAGPRATFRDFVLASRHPDKTERRARDLGYWITREPAIAAGPNLGWRDSAMPTRERVRIEATLSRSEWSALRDAARELEVSPTSLALDRFCQVIAEANGGAPFSLLSTFVNRTAPEYRDVIGPFISSNIFVVDDPAPAPAAQTARARHRRLWEDLERSSVSGIHVLRELRARGVVDRAFALPVVFTSLLNVLDGGIPRALDYRRHTFAVSQTPDVILDHQLFEIDGELRLSWDVAVGRWDIDRARALFATYVHALRDRADTPIDHTTADTGQEPFPLTDQQLAYAFDRAIAPEHACVFLQEFETTDLDPARLIHAWQRLGTHHDMLRAQVSADGTQRIARESALRICSHDLRATADPNAELERIRRTSWRRSQPSSGGDQGPFAEVHLAQIDDRRWRILIAIEPLIADLPSIELLLRQSFLLYRDPAKSLPAHASFRSVVIERTKRVDAPADSSKAYWRKKFESLPPAPTFALANATTGEHRRLSAVIPNASALERFAAMNGVDLSVALLGAYLEVLWLHNGHCPFTVAVPTWRREGQSDAIDQIVGDFTAMSWVSRTAGRRAFTERLLDAHDAIGSDRAHQAFTGLRAARDRGRNGARELRFPVVFTELTAGFRDALPSGFSIGEGATRTPRVALDSLAERDCANDALHVHWDFVAGLPAAIDRMFRDYLHVLQMLSRDANAWLRDDWSSALDSDVSAMGG